MASKKGTTALQRHRKRTYNQIRKAEQRGYRFDAGFREMVKNASVQQLSHWKGGYIYRYAEKQFVDEATGEVITLRGEAARARERSEAAKKREEKKRQEREEEEKRKKEDARANVIINNIINLLNQPNSNSRPKYVSDDADAYCSKLKSEIRKLSAEQASKLSLADRISANTDALEIYIDKIKWDSDQDAVTTAYNRVLEIISETVGININDDFFSSLDDNFW